MSLPMNFKCITFAQAVFSPRMSQTAYIRVIFLYEVRPASLQTFELYMESPWFRHMGARVGGGGRGAQAPAIICSA